MVDRHVVKMILESAQLLSTAHRMIDGTAETITVNGKIRKTWRLPDDREFHCYKVTHANHPCAKWVRGSAENYNWLSDHLIALLAEYTHRYGKVHKTRGMTSYITSPPLNIGNDSFTTPPTAMDVKYIISEDTMENYRNYYVLGKSHLHSWTRRDVPSWIHTFVNPKPSNVEQISP